MKMRKHIYALGVVAALALAGLAQAADPVVFDPDGGGPDTPIVINTFDWKPGNALADDALPPSEAGKPFNLLAHAALASFIDLSNNVILGTGLNSNYEITIQIGFGEIGFINPAVPGIIGLEFDPAGQTNFVSIWWDPDRDSNNLTGAGFGDGTPILTGTVTSGNGAYTDSGNDPEALDQFINNDYPGVATLVGAGGSSVTIHVDTFNAAFFPDGVPQTISFNTSNVTPYEETDPSASFTDAAGAVTPAIAPVNGVSGPDFQFQADANNSFELAEVLVGACRMTGGGVTYDGEIPLDDQGEVAVLAEADDGKNRYTFGGQIGAPQIGDPGPFGEWTHHQFKGPAGKFVFRAGTHSAPPETRVLAVTCSDEGFCNPARHAPFKQLDWDGVGSFRNVSGQLKSIVVPDNKPNFTLHRVFVHYEDIGEPGPGGKQPHSPACTHVIGTDIDESVDCANCPDVYQIRIHATEDANSAVIYEVGGFIDNGNIQIHPEIK